MMQYRNGKLIFSPTDLIAFVENEHVTWLDRYNLECPGELIRDEAAGDDAMIRSAGDAHERNYVAALASEGRDIVDLRDTPEAYYATLAAMRDGREVIYQARLELGPFAGMADFLIRVDGASEFGSYQYEVWDTKLARGMKPYFAIQLCCYAEMLAAVQGVVPARVGIVLGSGARVPLRTDSYMAYYRAVKADFLAQQATFDATQPPEFDGLADYRHWSGYVSRALEAADDLSRVANIRQSQVAKLRAAGIHTVTQLAETELARIPRMADDVFSRLRDQASLQLRSAGRAEPLYEIVPPPAASPRTGFGLLPPASPNDVCFDIEGYPLIDGGLEYLLGVTLIENGEIAFRDWWAHDRDTERRSFVSFVEWVYARWRDDPSMHVYHYAPYETAALKRLMGRYACCEQEIDDLLRNGVFVDLYTVVRQGLRVGEPAYSLKNIEHLYMPKRVGEVATAGDSMVYYHAWRESPDGAEWTTSKTLKLIREYNEQDCVSTWRLVEWLRNQQAAAGIPYTAARSESRAVSERVTARAQLAAAMLDEIPPDRGSGDDTERWRVHELLAHLLEFHRREAKPSWWEIFERASKTEDELIDDPDCLGGLRPSGSPPIAVKRSLVHEYEFEEQESKLRAGDECRCAHDLDLRIKLDSVDYDRRRITFTWGKNRVHPERLSIIPDGIVPAETIAASIERVVRAYRASGELQPAIADYLFRRRPRLTGAGLSGNPIEAALGMDRTTLCAQGPPGTGKTFTGGRMIAALLAAGKRVGITSNSHRAICLLLREAAEAADQLGIHFRGAKASAEEGQDPIHPSIEMLPGNADVFEGELPDLVGGTAWVFSREEAAGKFDYLFIDEAGQVSVANLVGMSAAAHNLVLLGDQMQLNQPLKGSHPGESGESALEYLLEDRATIPEDMGIFLARTWRLRPELCDFVSRTVYDGRLEPEPSTADRAIRFGTAERRYVTRSAGLLYIPVDHDDNTYESDEEADAIDEIVRELEGQYLQLPGESERRVTRDDLLVVAPFNLQVRKLASRLPGVRVGTVDKFQGQQAPVVVFSMTASEGDGCPRGIEFLFSKNRLNVAISRAQILAIVTGSPKLTRTRCSRLDQIELVNLFCQVAETGSAERVATALTLA